MNIQSFRKIYSALLVIFILSLSVFNYSYAQNTTNAPQANVVTEGAPRAIIVEGNNTYQPASLQSSQANNQNSNSQGGSFNASGASGSFASCSGSGALGNFAKNKISELVGSALGTRVPTANPVQEGKDTGILGIVSWDQIGWCLVNSIIESVGAATVNWINSGFQGNPVFVEDPEQFFADVADIQAGQFLDELSGGLLCTPIQDIVRVNLAQNYNNSISSYRDQSQCTFSGGAEQLEQFMSGNSFSWADWSSYTQNPYNNPYGASLYGQIELNSRIANSLGVQKNLLDWGGGFLSSKDPETGKITTPGSLLQDQLNERLGSGQRRLEIADEFDEIVNALVNQLVKVAISEMTQSN